MNKNETKNGLKAKLQLMVYFAQQAKLLGNQISKILAPNGDDVLFDLLNEIQDCELTEVEKIMSEIEKLGCLEEIGFEEGEPVAIPYISYGEGMYSMEVGVRYPNGEKLAAYVSKSDSQTFQVGSIFYTADESPVDLTMAEIKKGELAMVSNLPEDNKDIDLYVWADVKTEDTTHNFRLCHVDIMQAFEENQEGGDGNE